MTDKTLKSFISKEFTIVDVAENCIYYINTFIYDVIVHS